MTLRPASAPNRSGASRSSRARRSTYSARWTSATARPKSGGYDRGRRSASTGKRGFFGWLDAEPIGLTGIISTELCSDGMSDRDYGFAIDLILSDARRHRLAARLLPAQDQP
jgi:hypothetical protein